MSVVANFPASVDLVIMQINDHVNLRLISQLIDRTSRVLPEIS